MKRIREVLLAGFIMISALAGAFLLPERVHAAGRPNDTDVSSDDTYVETDKEDLDETPPKIKAWIQGEILYIHAEDEDSEISYICVNGNEFDELEDGEMCVDIKDYESDIEFITVYAVDEAGNKSKEYKLKNPYFVGEIEDNQTDLSLDNPDSVEATDPTYARGTVTDDFVTQGREFFTVEASGKVFYLIVDRTENAENVYLLTEAGVNDLLNFMDYNGIDVQNGTVPMYEIPGSSGNITQQSGSSSSRSGGLFGDKGSDTGTGDNPDGGSDMPKKNNSMIFVIVIAAVGGIAYYFFKNKKRKDDLSDAEDMDAFDTPDSKEIDEGKTEYEGEEVPEKPEEAEAVEGEQIYAAGGQEVPTIYPEIEIISRPKEDRQRFLGFVGKAN